MLRTLSKAKNVTFKAEMMQRRSFDPYKTVNIGVRAKIDDYGGSNQRYGYNRNTKEHVQEDKAVGKCPMNEGKEKETSKSVNPYAKLILDKCFQMQSTRASF